MKITIPFNKPFLTGKELTYIKQAVKSGKISGNGHYTKKCHSFFEQQYGFKKTLLTSSGTDALEMCAILAGIGPGDEVIMPSYTFVSTANAFVLRGAKIVFADSCQDNPNLDCMLLESLINKKTKAIVAVHYAGVACDMEKINELAVRHNLKVIEDAAQAIDSYYKNKPLGSIGHFSAFSFHETKNIISGEGGMLVTNHTDCIERSEIIWEKGTNRSAFFNGKVNKYEWVDIGSSFLPSEITAAFLYAQIENIQTIQSKRLSIWNQYFELLKPLENENLIGLPNIPDYATNNGHMFYLVCQNKTTRDHLIEFLKAKGILSVFHYLPLHLSKYFHHLHDHRELPNSIKFAERLIRLPLYYSLTQRQVSQIAGYVNQFFKKH
jgi:dTDP-4-amino-4,6-dideoxygalactose transaminase